MSPSPETLSAHEELARGKTKDEGLAVLYEMYRADLTAQAAKEKLGIEEDIRSDLDDLKKELGASIDPLEEEMVARAAESQEREFKKFLSIEFLEREAERTNVPVAQIVDNMLIKTFSDKFQIVLEPEDVASLRDDIPIVDDVQDGKFIAWGRDENGERVAHASAFDELDIQEHEGAIHFVYTVRIHVEGDESLQRMVDETSIVLGQSERLGHRFEADLHTDEKQDANVTLREVHPSDEDFKLLEGRDGVIINLGDGTFEILINQDASDKEGVVRHEIEHLVGMTHPEDEHEEHDHDEEAWKETILTTGRSSNEEEAVKDVDRRPEEEFGLMGTLFGGMANGEYNVENVQNMLADKKKLEIGDALHAVLDTNGFHLPDKYFPNVIFAAIQFAAHKMYSPGKDWGYLEDNAQALEEGVIGQVKERTEPLFQTMAESFNGYDDIAPDYHYQGKWNLEACMQLSSTLRGLLLYPNNLRDYLLQDNHGQVVSEVQQEIQASLSAELEIHQEAQQNEIRAEAVVYTSFESFDQLPMEDQQYLTRHCPLSLFVVADDPQPLVGHIGAQPDTAIKDFVVRETGKKLKKYIVDTPETLHVARLYYDHLEAQIDTPQEVHENPDAFLLKLEGDRLKPEFVNTKKWNEAENRVTTLGDIAGSQGPIDNFFGSFKEQGKEILKKFPKLIALLMPFEFFRKIFDWMGIEYKGDFNRKVAEKSQRLWKQANKNRIPDPGIAWFEETGINLVQIEPPGAFDGLGDNFPTWITGQTEEKNPWMKVFEGNTGAYISFMYPSDPADVPEQRPRTSGETIEQAFAFAKAKEADGSEGLTPLEFYEQQTGIASAREEELTDRNGQIEQGLATAWTAGFDGYFPQVNFNAASFREGLGVTSPLADPEAYKQALQNAFMASPWKALGIKTWCEFLLSRGEGFDYSHMQLLSLLGQSQIHISGINFDRLYQEYDKNNARPGSHVSVSVFVQAFGKLPSQAKLTEVLKTNTWPASSEVPAA